MHKVEIAGHAGTESSLLRPPVPKLLMGKSCHWWGIGLQVGGGSASRGYRCGSPALRQSERCNRTLWEVVPTWRSEQRVKADEHRTEVHAFLVTAAVTEM